jgi:hypothetical protein
MLGAEAFIECRSADDECEYRDGLNRAELKEQVEDELLACGVSEKEISWAPGSWMGASRQTHRMTLLTCRLW